jgi:hypothetical protein
MNILASYPELADEWIEDEERNKIIGKGYQYFEGISMKNMRDIAQNKLFKETDLSQITPAFDCACTS